MEIKELCKELYAEQDKLLEELVEAGEQVFEHAGHVAMIVDNFSGQSIVFKTTAVKRFDLKVTKKKGA